MSEERTVTAGETRLVTPSADDRRVAGEADVMLTRLHERLLNADIIGDAETVRWLHKQILSVERRAQERDAAMTPSASGAERRGR